MIFFHSALLSFPVCAYSVSVLLFLPFILYSFAVLRCAVLASVPVPLLLSLLPLIYSSLLLQCFSPSLLFLSLTLLCSLLCAFPHLFLSASFAASVSFLFSDCLIVPPLSSLVGVQLSPSCFCFGVLVSPLSCSAQLLCLFLSFQYPLCSSSICSHLFGAFLCVRCPPLWFFRAVSAFSSLVRCSHLFSPSSVCSCLCSPSIVTSLLLSVCVCCFCLLVLSCAVLASVVLPVCCSRLCGPSSVCCSRLWSNACRYAEGTCSSSCSLKTAEMPSDFFTTVTEL